MTFKIKAFSIILNMVEWLFLKYEVNSPETFFFNIVLTNQADLDLNTKCFNRKLSQLKDARCNVSFLAFGLDQIKPTFNV